jgi:hypothetical protein
MNPILAYSPKCLEWVFSEVGRSKLCIAPVRSGRVSYVGFGRFQRPAYIRNPITPDGGAACKKLRVKRMRKDGSGRLQR